MDNEPSSEEILCGRCCCPLQKARIKRSTTLALTGKAEVVLSKDINLMQRETFCFTEPVRTTLENCLFHVAIGLFRVKAACLAMQLLAFSQVLAWCVLLVLGNVEKTVFLGPEPIPIHQQHPNLQDLYLDKLSSSKPTLRLELAAAFPKPNAVRGEAAWFLLDGLRQHQRYEVRVCWAAIVSRHICGISSLWDLIYHVLSWNLSNLPHSASTFSHLTKYSTPQAFSLH